jgi:hypothetical protein
MLYRIIVESQKGDVFYFREPVAGQDARSVWVRDKYDATLYDDYYVAAGKISRLISWVGFGIKYGRFHYPRVIEKD